MAAVSHRRTPSSGSRPPSASSTTFIDPTRPAKFPIHLSDELLRHDRAAAAASTTASRKRHRTTVHLNHVPAEVHGRTGTLRKASAGSQETQGYELVVRGGDPHPASSDLAASPRGYAYRGEQKKERADTLALIFDPAKQAFLLDRLESAFTLNLHSTPSEDSASLVADRWPHISNVDSDQVATRENGGDGPGDGASTPAPHKYNDDDDDDSPDTANPYDYRHYLKGHASTANAGGSSPHVPSSSTTVSPATKYTKQQQVSPVKQQLPPSTTSPLGRKSGFLTHQHNTSQPDIKISIEDGNASPVRDVESDDTASPAGGLPNVLEIDMGDDTPQSGTARSKASAQPPKSWRSSLGVPGSDTSAEAAATAPLKSVLSKAAPISLRSAASSLSPSLGPRGSTPAQRSGPPTSTPAHPLLAGEGDGDVDEIDLGKASTIATKASKAADEGGEDGAADEDEDDILEAEMKQAFAQEEEALLRRQQQEQSQSLKRGAESSSESEEE